MVNTQFKLACIVILFSILTPKYFAMDIMTSPEFTLCEPTQLLKRSKYAIKRLTEEFWSSGIVNTLVTGYMNSQRHKSHLVAS